MIYMTGENKETRQPCRVIIISDGHLKRLKDGRPLKTPDGEVVICWTPDEPWLAERIADTNGDTTKVADLLAESLTRPPSADNRPMFATKSVQFKKDKDRGNVPPR